MAKKQKTEKRAAESSANEEEIVNKKAKTNYKDATIDQDSGDKVPEVKTYPMKELTSDGRKFNTKIVSWNVAGLRALVKKEGHKWFLNCDADIICLQETKCEEKKLPDDLKDIEGYEYAYWNAGEKPGHGGVAIISRMKPSNVEFGIPDKPEHSKEGRTITAEFEKFYLVCSYVPNSGRKLVRLDYRQEWNKDFQDYLKKLDGKKPVILCGDLNVSHQEIDLKNPKTNKKTAGFTQQERDGFTELLKQGFCDSFRLLYPDREGAYTFWTYMGNARAKNVGWRLDYFVISERLNKDICDNVIHSDVMGSDHCPLSLTMSLD
uniref:exodeoxyribonuclease-like n=1 Tax=Styela clava TaxID=7725 RepID=UPI0019395C1A|nr:exodeoxyribonuclease-like [Styela clava]